ncbi:hypothetical protein [Aeoliella mucimassa]|uniref:Uncharacterized protein n=1 Tax=Aeoliella mucimassa TaxID=2527972 RepID=A0A518AJL2_9BACT|nr:hypothetical protein [Aeoliella mucimassa]QDU54905.1 hypothetical protein Pan181_10900 [Aeoliella mucimassa]
MPRNRRILSLAFALAYSLIAVAGYGLHALVPCDDPTCGQAETSCDCFFCGLAHEEDTVDLDLPGGQIGTPKHGAHQPGQCAVCCTLAKIKVGQTGLDAAILTSAVSFGPQPVAMEAAPTAQLLVYAPRGPPALQA